MADFATLGLNLDASGMLAELPKVKAALDMVARASDLVATAETKLSATFSAGVEAKVAYNRNTTEASASAKFLADALLVQKAAVAELQNQWTVAAADAARQQEIFDRRLKTQQASAAFKASKAVDTATASTTPVAASSDISAMTQYFVVLKQVQDALVAIKQAQSQVSTTTTKASQTMQASDIVKELRAREQLREAEKAYADLQPVLATALSARLAAERNLIDSGLRNTVVVHGETDALRAQQSVQASLATAGQQLGTTTTKLTAAQREWNAAQSAQIKSDMAEKSRAIAKAKDDEAKALNAATKAAQENAAAEKAAAKAAADAAKATTELTSVLTTLGVALSAGQIAAMSFETLKLSARYETLGVVLDVVGKNVSVSRTEMEAYGKSLQETGISAIGSREELARMAGANLDLAKSAAVARVAQDAAVIAGTNSSEAFERMITGITTQQPRVLRTLGIYVNFEAAQERYAKANKIRVETLSAEEKVRINLNTALEGGVQIAGAYEAAMGTAGKQLTSTVRYMEDMKRALGESFLPEFTLGVKLYAGTLKLVGDYANFAAPIIAGVFVTAIGLATAAMWKLVAAQQAVTATGGWVSLAIGGLVLLGSAFASYLQNTEDAVAAREREKKSLDEASQKYTEYTRAIKKMTEAQLEAELVTAQQAVRIAQQVQVGANEAVRNTPKPTAPLQQSLRVLSTEDPSVYARALRDQKDAATEVSQAMQNLTVIQQERDDRIAASIPTEKEKAASLREYQKALRDLNEQIALQSLLLKQGANDTLDNKRAVEDLTRANKFNADLIEIAERFDAAHVSTLQAKRTELEKLTTAVIGNTRQMEDYRRVQALVDTVVAASMDALDKALAENRTNTNLAIKITDELTAARKKAREEILAERDALIANNAVLAARDGVTKKEIEYRNLLAAKIKEYRTSLQVDKPGQDIGAEAERAAKTYVGLVREQDALIAKTTAWNDVLKDTQSLAQSLGAAFGDVGKQIAGAVDVGFKLYEIIKKQAEAQKAASLAQAAASAGTGTQAAADAAGSAAAAATLSSVLSIAAVAVSMIKGVKMLADHYNKISAEQTRLQQEFVKAIGEFTKALDDATRSVYQSKQDAMNMNIATLIDKAGAASGMGAQSTLTTARSADELKLLQQQMIDLIAASSGQARKNLQQFVVNLNMVIEASKKAGEAFAKEQAIKMRIANEDLNLRALIAAGQTDAADALRLQLAQERELAAARNEFAGSPDFDAYIRHLQDVQAAEKQAADAAKEMAEALKKEAAARKIFDLTNATKAFSDPRGAGLDALIENQRRRYDDAADAAEKAAVALYNAAEMADYLAKQFEADARVTEGLVARISGTLGNDRKTQDIITAAQQRQELADAIANGMSPSNLALLQFTQFAENSFTQMNRNIEDGTKAIEKARDAAIKVATDRMNTDKAIHEQTIKTLDDSIATAKADQKASKQNYDDQIAAVKKNEKAQLDALDRQISALEAVVATVEKLSDYLVSLKLGALSILSPEQKLAEARNQFELVAAAAAGGNATAAGKLPDAANALLDASRSWNASGSGFVADFNRVQDAVTGLIGAAGPVDRQMLEVMKQQRQEIQDSAAADILILESARDVADAGFTNTISGLEALKTAENDNWAKYMLDFDAYVTSIKTNADAEIERLKLVEQQAHQQRLQGNANWATFLGLLKTSPVDSGNPNDVNYKSRTRGATGAAAAAGGADIFSSLGENTQGTVTELKAAVSLLQSGFAAVRDELVTTNGLLDQQLRVSTRTYNEA